MWQHLILNQEIWRSQIVFVNLILWLVIYFFTSPNLGYFWPQTGEGGKSRVTHFLQDCFPIKKIVKKSFLMVTMMKEVKAAFCADSFEIPFRFLWDSFEIPVRLRLRQNNNWLDQWTWLILITVIIFTGMMMMMAIAMMMTDGVINNIYNIQDNATMMKTVVAL